MTDIERVTDYIAKSDRDAEIAHGLPAGAAERPVHKVGIVGAGTMGTGIAMNFANVGIPVRLVETSRAALDKGFAIIRKNYEGSVRRGKLTEEIATARLALFSGMVEYSALGDCDLIIEAVFEDIDIKKTVFRKLDKVAKPNAILASNTSHLNLDEIAAATSRPNDVIGLHFFSPANVMRLLEIVRGEQTSPHVIATARSVAKKIQKISVVVGVGPGFVGNRMLRQRQNQAQFILGQGVMPWRIDKVIRDFGFPMGPFEMSDLAGLDLGWSRANSRGISLRDRLCEVGRVGQKASAGYYDYDENRKATPSPLVESMILDIAAGNGYRTAIVSNEEILQRCLYPMINEGTKILSENKVTCASDIDVVWRNGYGWPSEKGGPMFYADMIGLSDIVAALHKLAASEGDMYLPSDLLVQTSAGSGTLHSLRAAISLEPVL